MRLFLTRKRNVGFLLLTVILLSLFSWFVISFPPTKILNHIFLYLLIFGIFYSFLMYVFARVTTALVLSCGITLYFFLRFLQLRHSIYGVILFICCIAVLRLVTSKRVKEKHE